MEEKVGDKQIKITPITSHHPFTQHTHYVPALFLLEGVVAMLLRGLCPSCPCLSSPKGDAIMQWNVRL